MNSNNEDDIIVIKYNDAVKIPYFEGMMGFYNIGPGQNVILERSTSGFSNDEFDALRKILAKKGTEKYEISMFLRNYLLLPENYPNTYNPTLPARTALPKPQGYFRPAPGKKQRQRRFRFSSRNNNWNLNEPTRKELLKEAEMANRQVKRENVAALVENILGPNRVNMVVSETEKAEAIRSKYPKSGKRPSKTSRTTAKHLANKRLRQTLRKLNKRAKELKYEEN